MCVCVFADLCVCPWRPGEGLRSPEAVVTECWELPHLGAGNPDYCARAASTLNLELTFCRASSRAHGSKELFKSSSTACYREECKTYWVTSWPTERVWREEPAHWAWSLLSTLYLSQKPRRGVQGSQFHRRFNR